MNTEVRSLTGLRGIAAFLVLAYHAQYMAPAGSALREVLSFVFGAGYIGVDLFFVLSGFVIATNYAGTVSQPLRGTYGRYIVKRLARVYPLHLFVLAVLWLSTFTDWSAVPGGKDGSDELLRSLLLVHAWGTNLTFAWNGPSWSISAEFLVYMLFPVITSVALRIKRPLTCALLCALLYAIFYRVCYWYKPDSLLVTASRIGCEFCAGVLLYQLTKTATLPKMSAALWPAIALLVVGSVLVEYSASDAIASSVFSFSAWLVVLFAVVSRSRILESKAFNYWGRISFAVYMVHAPVITASYKALTAYRLQFNPTACALTILAIVLVVHLVAAACYRYVEEPARKFILNGATSTSSGTAIAAG